MVTTIPKARVLLSFPPRGRSALTAPADLLGDRNGAEQDHERQDGEDRDIAGENGDDILARRCRARRGGCRILTETRRVDAGIRIPTWSAQGRQRAPTAAVVVLDFLEGARREPHRQVVAGGHRQGFTTGLRRAADAVDVAANLDPRRRGRGGGIWLDGALDRLGAGRRPGGARAKVDHDPG